MTVLTFASRFARLVESGAKPHTIRGERKRPIKVGDQLSLREWTGRPYGSPQRILRETTCSAVQPIMIRRSLGRTHIALDGVMLTPDQAEAFAQADGFGSVFELLLWFSEHGELPFNGWLIRWQP
jgi:hypothetical protein